MGRTVTSGQEGQICCQKRLVYMCRQSRFGVTECLPDLGMMQESPQAIWLGYKFCKFGCSSELCHCKLRILFLL